MSLAPEPGLSRDRVLGGRLHLLQPRRGYRVAIDPVLLAAAVPATAGERVLDAGAGSGAASLCLAWRIPGSTVTGLELSPELLALARENTRLNGLEGRVEMVAGDLLDPPSAIRVLPFDQVLTNPPFHATGAASPPASTTARAAHLAAMPLAEWLQACLARLRPHGWLTLIHNTDRLDAILAALAGRAGDIAVLPLWPRVGAAARRVVVTARKGSRGPTRLLPGLVLHGSEGHFTPAADAILRDGAALPLLP